MSFERLSRALSVIGQGLGQYANYSIDREQRALEAKRQEAMMRLEHGYRMEELGAQQDFQKDLFEQGQAADEKRFEAQNQISQRQADLSERQFEFERETARTEQSSRELDRIEQRNASVVSSFQDRIDAIQKRIDKMRDESAQGGTLLDPAYVQELEDQKTELLGKQLEKRFEGLRELRDRGASWLQGKSDEDLQAALGYIEAQDEGKAANVPTGPGAELTPGAKARVAKLEKSSNAPPASPQAPRASTTRKDLLAMDEAKAASPFKPTIGEKVSRAQAGRDVLMKEVRAGSDRAKAFNAAQRVKRAIGANARFDRDDIQLLAPLRDDDLRIAGLSPEEIARVRALAQQLE